MIETQNLASFTKSIENHKKKMDNYLKYKKSQKVINGFKIKCKSGIYATSRFYIFVLIKQSYGCTANVIIFASERKLM